MRVNASMNRIQLFAGDRYSSSPVLAEICFRTCRRNKNGEVHLLKTVRASWGFLFSPSYSCDVETQIFAGKNPSKMLPMGLQTGGCSAEYKSLAKHKRPHSH